VKADHTDNALIAAIKALDEVVAPAIDTSNPLALEQLKLVSRFLGFLRQRLPYQSQRDRFELHHYMALARELSPLVVDASLASQAQRLNQGIDDAATTIDDRDASTAQVRDAVERLTTAISVLVRSVGSADPVLRGRVERKVVSASAALFDMQRAWYLPMGFEPDPERVPTVQAALAAGQSS
jgi:hypothetical protein